LRPARITSQGTEGGKAFVKFAVTKTPIAAAELAFTRDTGKWQDRKWETVPAELVKNRASAAVPADAKAFYLNLFDGQGRVVSGEMEDR
jgi:hypothetical protein